MLTSRINFRMAAPKKVCSPEKEIRFTRAAQGRLLLVLAAFFLGLSLGLLVLATQGTDMEPPRLQGHAWAALLPLSVALVLIRFGLRCIRHAYLIFTPLGLEIFPLFRPEKYMMLVTWCEVHDLTVDLEARRLSLHYNSEKSSGVILSLSPILAAQRLLLDHAVRTLMSKRDIPLS